MTTRHLLPLDGIRGLAILMVFAFHYGGGVSPLLGVGWAGVDLFFVLSGFLITGILYDSQRAPDYYRTFYVRRSLRIFPIYYLLIAISLVIVPVALWRPGHLWFLVYLGYPAALMLPLDQIPVHVFHLWSLSIEEQFYMVWPALVKRLRTPTRILRMCAVVAAVSLGCRVAFAGSLNGWSDLFFLCRLDGLAVGATLAIWRRQGIAINGWAWLWAGGLAFVALAFARGTVARGDVWISTIGYTCLAVGFGGLLTLALGPLSAICSSRVLRVFGTYSYGLYLYHVPLAPVLARLRPAHTPAIAFVAGALLVNLLLAMASYHLIERPILRLKDRYRYRMPLGVAV